MDLVLLAWVLGILVASSLSRHCVFGKVGAHYPRFPILKTGIIAATFKTISLNADWSHYQGIAYLNSLIKASTPAEDFAISDFTCLAAVSWFLLSRSLIMLLSFFW